jgi:hypothetical protein
MAKKRTPKAGAEPVPTAPAEPIAEVPQRFEVVEIPRIHVTSANLRKTFNDEDLNELAASIREHGILEPLVVRQILHQDPLEYELIAGERRLRAAIIAGREGVGYSYQVTTHDEGVAWNITDPSWLSINGTGAITGTLSVDAAGEYEGHRLGGDALQRQPGEVQPGVHTNRPPERLPLPFEDRSALRARELAQIFSELIRWSAR